MNGDASVPSDSPAAPSWDGLFVGVAVKLWARTGAWPPWFARVVGDPVPSGYVALALHHRRALVEELGVALPIAPAPSLSMPGVKTARSGLRASKGNASGERLAARRAKR